MGSLCQLGKPAKLYHL